MHRALGGKSSNSFFGWKYCVFESFHNFLFPKKLGKKWKRNKKNSTKSLLQEKNKHKKPGQKHYEVQ
ncbi:MAG: hypothetical protein AYK18_02050 [Theionarchaea archaeon DG-70]|nr:MAG: hypothetical protein AYK18_02050 [Theionarchaea archaeon DG-70]